MARAFRHTKTIGIIGAGRFGTGAASELLHLGHEVLVVDQDEQALALLPKQVHTVIGNAEHPEFLIQAGFKEVDAAIVAIGSNETASNHATINCKDLGRFVVSKAFDRRHGTILERLGADKIVYPEYDSGVRLARMLSRTAILDMVELYEEIFMMELEARGRFVDQTLEHLDLPRRYGIQVILVRRNGKPVFPIGPKELILSGDVLVCIGTSSGLTSFAGLMDV